MNELPIGTTGSLWSRWVLQPIITQLKQGTTPERIALSITLGLVVGVFPILGATTFLCGVAAWRLRLNQPLIQLTNYMMTPIHVLLLLPFYRAGETLFQQPHVPIFSVNQLVDRFSASPVQFMADYSMVGIYGIVVWCLLAPLAMAVSYLTLRPALRHLSQHLPQKGTGVRARP